MGIGGERKVQDEILAKAAGLGWQVVSEVDMNVLRAGHMSDAIVIPLLDDAVRKLNPGIENERVEAVIERLRSASDPAEFLRWRRYGINVPLAGKPSLDVRLVDLADPVNNDYVVTEEMVIATGGAREPRLDVVFLVNGLPLGIVENKAPTEPFKKAARDLARYWEDAPHLAVVGAIAGICNGSHFRVAPTGQFGLSAYAEWKDTYPHQRPAGAGELDTVLLGVFDPHTLADLAANFIVFETRDGVTRKKLARYQQFRAASKLVRRAVKGVLDRGIIWHTQGSGKSLTMIFAARKLLAVGLSNPTVLIVVDRTDLDDQISDTLTACEFDGVLRATSTKTLHQALAADRTGVIVTTIHKFRDAAAGLMSRENVVVLVDEAHRTQEGDLGIDMRAALPAAKLFAFTGTPIESNDHSTRKAFSPEINGNYEDYLDAYRIKEAIDDGATVPIIYDARMPEWAVTAEDIDEPFEQSLTGLTDEQKAEVRKRATRLAEIAKAPARITAIGADVVDYLEHHTAPNGFKAQFVAVDRMACALIAEQLAAHLRPDEFAVVISRHKNDPDVVRRWYASAQLGRLGASVPESSEGDATEVSAGPADPDNVDALELSVAEKKAVKQLIKRFTDPDDPMKLLIVNNMLLTGFDAPVEQVMFLDRGLAGHNLLQAIARTNRPMPEQNKRYGIIVDYWGVFANLETALRTFNAGDVERAAVKVDELRERFPEAVAEALAVVIGYPDDGSEDKQAAWLLTRMADEDRARKFEQRWDSAKTIYETLAPDPGLKPYLSDYRRLAEIHARLRAAHGDAVFDVQEYVAKTVEIVRDAIDVAAINRLADAVRIDGTLLDKLGADKTLTPEEKAAQIEAALVHEIKANPHDPVMQKLSERLEELREQKLASDAQITKLLGEYEQLVLDVEEHQAAPNKLGVSEPGYALLELVRQRAPEASAEVTLEAVKRIDQRLPEVAGFDGWETRDDVLKAVSKILVQELAKDEATRDLVIGPFVTDALGLLVSYAAQE